MNSAKSTSSRRSGVRTRSVVSGVAGLALVAGLAACGDEAADDTATDPASSSSPDDTGHDSTSEPSGTTAPPETDAGSGSGAQQTIPAGGSAGVTEATLVSATEGGGTASSLAFALDGDQAVADFAGQLDGGLGDTVSAAAEDVARQSPGATPYGATVAVGCVAPSSVVIDGGEAGFEVVPEIPKNDIQCLAPVTYVVLFAVPDA